MFFVCYILTRCPLLNKNLCQEKGEENVWKSLGKWTRVIFYTDRRNTGGNSFRGPWSLSKGSTPDPSKVSGNFLCSESGFGD